MVNDSLTVLNRKTERSKPEKVERIALKIEKERKRKEGCIKSSGAFCNCNWIKQTKQQICWKQLQREKYIGALSNKVKSIVHRWTQVENSGTFFKNSCMWDLDIWKKYWLGVRDAFWVLLY